MIYEITSLTKTCFAYLIVEDGIVCDVLVAAAPLKSGSTYVTRFSPARSMSSVAYRYVVELA